jgi:hypothetical protein
VPPKRCDQELAEWFAAHGGAWSGTASELLAALRTRVDAGSDFWPMSSRALYARLESHGQVLRSLGLDVLLRDGYPRMITLRPYQNEEPSRTPPVVASGINIPSDPPVTLPPPTDNEKTGPADSSEPMLATKETVSPDIPPAKPDLPDPDERLVHGKYANGDKFEGRVFENTGEALFAIGEMRVQIREQGLDPKSAIDLVVGRTKEITRSSGVAVGLLQQGSVVYVARAGIAPVAGPHFQADFFQSSLGTGKAFQLRDAQHHPLVGATCRREGIKSLIVVPVFRNREIAGTMELLFQQGRSFSTGDVLDIELIAGVVSEALSGPGQIESKQPEGTELPPQVEAVGHINPKLIQLLNQEAELVDAVPSSPQDAASEEKSSMKSAAPDSTMPVLFASRLTNTPTLLWRAFKKAWSGRTGAA